MSRSMIEAKGFMLYTGIYIVFVIAIKLALKSPIEEILYYTLSGVLLFLAIIGLQSIYPFPFDSIKFTPTVLVNLCIRAYFLSLGTSLIKWDENKAGEELFDILIFKPIYWFVTLLIITAFQIRKNKSKLKEPPQKVEHTPPNNGW